MIKSLQTKGIPRLIAFWVMQIVLLGTVYAQQKITGTVTDEYGSGMPGVNVLVQDTSEGTITDVNGNYSVQVSDGNQVLVFSFVGYKPAEVSISGRSVIDITLEPDLQQLEEIVVVG